VIETIAVARMLRETVTTPYPNLVTRPTGVAVRGRIESLLATSEWEMAMLDFSEVELLDLSCADEVVAKLVRLAQERLGRLVALRGLHEHLLESIHAVLEHQHLLVAVLSDGCTVMLGAVPDDVRLVFEALDTMSPCQARALSARLGWNDPRTDAALDAAHRVGLARHLDTGYVRVQLA
jgi:hypothetical protein